MTLRILIADDELLARKRLKRLIEAIDDVELAGVCDSGEAVLNTLKEEDVDVLLLDIQMPGLTGLEAAALLPSPAPRVIFCTAYSEHAVAAFEQGAVDYLLKPIEAGRLKKALERARGRATTDPENGPGKAKLERLAISTRKGIILLDPESVSHAVIEGELVRLVSGETSYLTDYTLNDLEGRLPKDRFERVHRQALINLDSVETLEPVASGGYIARMLNGDLVTVSRSAARRFRRRFGI